MGDVLSYLIISCLNLIRTVNRNLTKGFEEQLSWNFSLTADLTLSSVRVELEDVNTDVALIYS